jgi:hypothetical protein
MKSGLQYEDWITQDSSLSLERLWTIATFTVVRSLLLNSGLLSTGWYGHHRNHVTWAPDLSRSQSHEVYRSVGKGHWPA